MTFSLAGTTVGTATLANGRASLNYTVPTGKARSVAAAYYGDEGFTASSASTARHDPTITAKVTSVHARTSYGWYRTPVTVSFTCTTHGAALTTSCPKPATLSKNRAGQSVSRTIVANDGGTATVTVSNINVDRSAPKVTITGAHNNGIYSGATPKVRCSGGDTLSGLASCKLTETLSKVTNGVRVSYTAIASDRAGNTATARGSITVLTVYIQGPHYSDGAYTIKHGHTCTLVVAGAPTKPDYHDVAPYPQKPHPKDTAFYHAGHNKLGPSRDHEQQAGLSPLLEHRRQNR